MPIKPLYIEEVMRFIYILGILLLIAIGFLVYVYRDSLWGTIDGFQAGGAGNVVFQLFEHRCHNINTLNNNTSTFPTVSKSNAILICHKLGGRLAMYDELKRAVSSGLVIDSDRPAMVVDSDKTYSSNNNVLVYSSIENNRLKYLRGDTSKGPYFATSNTGVGYDDFNRVYYGGCDSYNSQPVCQSTMQYYDLNGYTIDSPRWQDNPNVSMIKWTRQQAGEVDFSREIALFERKPRPTEAYGHPVCIAPTAPPGNTLDVVFPERVGKGWTPYTDTIGNFTTLRGTSFTKRYNIRKAGDTTPFTAICPMTNTGAPGSTIILASAPVISLNTPTPTTSQTSYKILDLDKVYSQIDIAKIDLPKRRDAVIQAESANIAANTITDNLNPNLFVDLSGSTQIDQLRARAGYSFIKKEMANTSSTSLVDLSKDFTNVMKTILPYWNPLDSFMSSNSSNSMTTQQYSNILIKNVIDYYSYLLLEIQSHPIAFLRKGTVNFPSMLNTFKIYNFPNGGSVRTSGRDYFGWTSDPPWEFYGNGVRLTCVDGTSDYYYRLGSIAGWDFRESSKTNYDHNPDGWWCRHTQGLSANLSCEGGHGYSAWAATCLKEYARAYLAITDAYYMIASQNTQASYDIYNTTKYKRIIDTSWRSVKDANNPITIVDEPPERTIPVKGTISPTNITEIERSINYTICLNFTDTSRIESQIRISSDDLQLYMSPDASGQPEFQNSIDPVAKTSTITPLHASHNFLHTGILITPEIFYCLPFHTRNMIDHWASIRHARVLQWKNGQGSTVNLVGTGALGSTPTTPAWNQGNNPAAPTSTQGSNSATSYIAGTSTNAPIKGSLFNTSITPAVRNAFLDSMAQFYYTNERTDLGSDGGANAQGYATMNKIVDVFQIGDTIFDVRFEEYRKRGLLFQRKLQEIDAEYNSYKRMNLSKEDQISLEEKYLNKKSALYTADDNYVWGQTQACGVKAQYVVINSSTSLFNISQIVIINSAGQNVALSSTLYSSSQTGDTTNSNIIYNTSPENLDYINKNDDPRVKNYYDNKTGDILTGNDLLSIKNTSITAEKSAKEALLTDGILTPRHSSLCYKTMSKVPTLAAFGAVTTATVAVGNYFSENGIATTDAPYVPLIIDLGQQENISVVQIILPSDASTTSNPYRVELNNTIVTANSITIGAAAGAMSSATGVIDSLHKTVTFKFPGDGADKDTCPLGVYNRFKLARFYTDYTQGAANPWIVRGYSTGIAAALTFDPKYNAGVAIDITINGGNMQPAYYPKVDFNLNRAGSGASAGSPPILNCLDPTQIVTIFNDYNLLVNSDSFRSKTQTRTLPIQNPNEKYTAITVKKALQVDNNTCAYMWTDKVMNVTDAGNYAANGSLNTIDRVGIFPYPFDTQNFTSYERVLDISGINIFSTTLPTSNTLIQSMQTLSGFTIPEKYRKSVTLDTKNGFCPALPCSDTQVMNSILNIYNSQLSTYQGSSSGTMPAISKVYKAITPNPNQCEYLVDTVGGTTQRKVLFNIGVYAPNSISMGKDMYGNATTNDTCIWAAQNVSWDFAPDMVDSAPFLTRTYNYALDIMRPFTQNVTNVVNNLVNLGSAQLDPAGSGIMNALVQYRTETAAAAGDIRYWQYETDEFGNKCVPDLLTSGSYNSENYPRCRSAAVLDSLYKYYSSSSGSGSSASKISKMIRAGMTDDGKCDFTFEATSYGYSGAGILSQTTTSGLRCEAHRIPFSCDFEVTTCAYINPVPALSDISAIPSQFVQSLWIGSGSGSDPTKGSGSGSNPPAITAAGLNASGSQQLSQPANGQNLLRSFDYVDCASDYGGNSTNTGLTTCANGNAFIKTNTSLMYVKSGSGSLPTGITLSQTPATLDAVRLLVPYTVVAYAGASSANTFEYRITTSDHLDFGKTYIRAGFYMDSRLGTMQLAYLVPATPIGSPNAFFANGQTRSIPALANQFLSYWNAEFTKNKNIGNKIGTIRGYSISLADDSITFQASSATFGELGEYDIQYYYPTAYYKVYFRIPYSTGSAGSSPIMYKMEPTRKQSIITSSSETFTNISGGGSGGGSGVGSGRGSGGGSGGGSDSYIVQSPITVMTTKSMFRSFRFTVKGVTQENLGATNPRTRAEISRLYFWSSGSSPGSSGTSGTTSTTFNRVDVKNATVTLAGTYANYKITSGSCEPGYIPLADPTNESITQCQIGPTITNQSYPAVSDGASSYVACGIGYYKDDSNPPRCVPTGYFQDVINPLIVNTNMYVPRLRLNVDQALTVDFNEISIANAFSFILGSANNRPLRWVLEGSINNRDWIYLYNQQTDFNYGLTAGSSSRLSFYNPGYFFFSMSSGSTTNQLGSGPTRVAQLPMQTQMATETREGFLNPDASKKRMRHLRWKIMETQRPNAPYVHASMLQFHTRAGPIPASAIKLSNPLGTRRKSADGPSSLLSDSNHTRWVDYNKSDLLIMFDLAKLPANPIYGFQFTIPENVENSVEFLPARWVLEGSYDGRIWTPIHEKSDRARIMGAASPIYKFSEQI